jgi:hypothetical protein
VPTRKQKRRQQKLRRHEYEEVYVDEEGNVVEADETDAQAAPTATQRRNGRATPQRQRRAAATRTREIKPPSWRRVLKRGLIFAPIMFIVISLLAGNELSLAQRVTQTLFLVLIFLPFSYVMDSLTYRIWRKRAGAG